MIFLSHNYKNKNVVEPIFVELSESFPSEDFFYDEWSIQPGQSIPGKISEGLKDTTLFLLFWSLEASNSKMVEKEWLSAITKSVYEGMKFILILLDNTPVPDILRDLKHLNYFSNGRASTLLSIKSVISGENTFTPKYQNENNISFDIKMITPYKEWIIEFKANQHVAYNVIYFIAADNLENIELSYMNSGITMGGSGTIKINNRDVKYVSIKSMQGYLAPGSSDKVRINLKNIEIVTSFVVGYQVGSEIIAIGEFKSNI